MTRIYNLRAVCTLEEAALNGVTNTKLQQFLAFGKTFNCADVKIGDSMLGVAQRSRRKSI